MNVLSHLGCDKVFDYFEKICEIPHGSFHEKALSDYMQRKEGFTAVRIIK